MLLMLPGLCRDYIDRLFRWYYSALLVCCPHYTWYCYTEGRCLMGLQSADWVVFNTHQQLELMRVTCGGWRRPFAFRCTSPTNLFFTYHQPRIGTTHVHRRGPGRPRQTPNSAQGGLQGPPATAPALSAARSDPVTGSCLAAYARDHGEAAQLASEGYSAGGVGAQQGINGGATSEQGTRVGAGDRCGTPQPYGASAWGSGSWGGVVQGGGGEPVTSLHAVHHGREVLCCALLPSSQSQHAQQTDRPSSHSCFSHSRSRSSDSHPLLNQAPELASSELEDCSMQLQDSSPLCLLTGSEDGTMRQLLYSPPDPSETPLQSPSDTPSGTPHTPVSQQPHGANIPSAAQSSASSMKSPLGQGRSVRVSNTIDEGRAGSGGRQQGKAVREACDRQQKGLYGANEVGFQAAGSAVKSIVAMSLGAGRRSMTCT